MWPIFDVTGWLLHCDTPNQPAVFIPVRRVGVLARIGNFCHNPNLSCLLFSFQWKGKVKCDRAMFRLGVRVYTGGGEQTCNHFQRFHCCFIYRISTARIKMNGKTLVFIQLVWVKIAVIRLYSVKEIHFCTDPCDTKMDWRDTTAFYQNLFPGLLQIT